MKRIPTFVSALSLLLCVIVVILWIRSYWVSDHLSLIARHGCDFGSFRGQLRFLVGEPRDPRFDGIMPPGWPPVPPGKAGWQYMGIPCASDNWEAFEAKTFWTLDYNFIEFQNTWLGFTFQVSDGSGFNGSANWPQTPPFLWTMGFWQLMVPNWAVVVLTVVFPLVSLSRARQQRRRKKLGLCAHCGYDLRANVSGVCPECGELFAQIAVEPVGP